MAESKSEIITKDKPHWQTESLGYKGVDLTLNGVTHTKATFEAHEEAFRENIKASDAVLLELAPRAEGLIDEKGDFTTETINAFLKIYKMSPEELRKRLEQTRGDFGFFCSVRKSGC